MSGILPEKHQVRTGAVSTTTSGAAVTIIAAPDFGRLHVTALQFGRTDSGIGVVTATLNDTAATTFVIPNGISGSSGIGASWPYVFDTPLVFSNKTAMTMSTSAAVSTLFASAQGFTLE